MSAAAAVAAASLRAAQDTLLGAKLITQRDTFIGKQLMMNILMNIMDWDGTVPMPTILKPEPLWTGKQVGLLNRSPLVCSLVWRWRLWGPVTDNCDSASSMSTKPHSEPLWTGKQVGGAREKGACVCMYRHEFGCNIQARCAACGASPAHTEYVHLRIAPCTLRQYRWRRVG